MVLGKFTPKKPVCFLSKHNFPSLRKHTAGRCPQSQVHFQLSLCREALQALSCLQEPRHGHSMAVPSRLIFCLNINRWVNISNFLCPSGCRGFICVREGFGIRASHWGSLQAICSGRLMSCSEITPCSLLASSAVLQRASHTKPNWFKETTAQLLPACCCWGKMGVFPWGWTDCKGLFLPFGCLGQPSMSLIPWWFGTCRWAEGTFSPETWLVH